MAERPCGEVEAREHTVGGGKPSGCLPPIPLGPARPEQPSPGPLPSATPGDPAMPWGTWVPSQHPPSERGTLALLIQKKPWVRLQHDSAHGEEIKPCGRHVYSKGVFRFFFSCFYFCCKMGKKIATRKT